MAACLDTNLMQNCFVGNFSLVEFSENEWRRVRVVAEQSTALVLTKENDSDVVMDSTALRYDINTYFQCFYVHITWLYTIISISVPCVNFVMNGKNILQLTLNRFIIYLRKKGVLQHTYFKTGFGLDLPAAWLRSVYEC